MRRLPFPLLILLKKRPSRRVLFTDTAAGLAVAMVLIPQSMAYAHLAGLPPIYGLYAACIPLWIATLFGSCPILATGPVAMTSLLVHAVLSDTSRAELATVPYTEKALLLSLLSGAVLLAITAFRLTAVFNFISFPVLAGFTNGGALVILLSQLSPLTGLPMDRSRVFVVDVFSLLASWKQWQPLALVFGLFALLLALLIRRLKPRWPAFLLSLLAALALSSLARYETLHHGAVLGPLPRGLPPLSWPLRCWHLIPALLPGAVVVSLIGFMEVMAITRAVSLSTRKKYDLDRELLGQGLARVMGSFTSAYPVSGSFSRTALNLAAGARTRLANFVAGLAVIVTLQFLTPLLRPLPHSVLAAIIILAVVPLIRLPSLFHIVRVNRQDGIAAFVTFFATLLLAPKIVEGILIGASLSVALFLYRTMTPHAALLARHPDGTFRDAQRHRLDLDPEVLIFRFDSPLYFANTRAFEESLTEALDRFPNARAVLFVCDGITDLDASGEETLRNLCQALTESGIQPAFAEVKWKVMDVLERTGLTRQIGAHRFFRTVEAGFQTLKSLPLTPTAP